MTWVKVSDQLPEQDVFEREKVGPLGGWMHLSALAFCNRALSDGRLSRSRARRLIDVDDPDVLIAALITHGLWRALDDDELEIVDYLADQPSKEKVEAKREAWAERTRRSRANKPKVSRRDTSRDIGSDSRRESPRPVPVRDKGVAGSAPLPPEPPDDDASYGVVRDGDSYRFVTDVRGLAGEFAGWARECAQVRGPVTHDASQARVTLHDIDADGAAWQASALEWVALQLP